MFFARDEIEQGSKYGQGTKGEGGREAERPRDRETERQRDRETERQRDREIKLPACVRVYTGGRIQFKRDGACASSACAHGIRADLAGLAKGRAVARHAGFAPPALPSAFERRETPGPA